MKYLLDTCIVEALLKAEPGHESIRERIAAAPQGSLAISALTAVEIWTRITGAREPRAKRVAFEAYLKLMRVAAFDAAAARQAFVIQRYLRQTGQQIGRTDPLIAAQAIAMGAVCVLPTTSGTFFEFQVLSSKTGSRENKKMCASLFPTTRARLPTTA